LWAWHGIKAHSGLGKRLGEDYGELPLTRLYRVSDQRLQHREEIEEALFSRLQTLFGLEASVTLYDLTNTYFEGAVRGNGKVKAMNARLMARFEAGLERLAASLTKPRGIKNADRLRERIERLKERHAVGQHYRIDVQTDADQAKAIGLSWQRDARAGSRLTDPGVHCLRTNVLEWDEETLWRTYTTLTDLEAVFRSLKSELELRPIPHSREDRTDGHLFITVLAYQFVQFPPECSSPPCARRCRRSPATG
jgi:hypothetical protein